MCKGRLQPADTVLLRVEFDDELFLNGQADVFAFRKIEHRAAELLGIQLQPRRNASAASRFHGLADLVILAALFTDLNHFALPDLVRGDVVLLSVHLDVSVPDQLPRLCARSGKSERVNDVVQTQLELAEKIVAGNAVLLRGAPEIQTELPFQQAVNALDLLLLTKLQAIAQDFGTTPAMLTGGVVAALDGALVFEATVPFEEQLHALTPAQPANGIGVTSHLTSYGSDPPT